MKNVDFIMQVFSFSHQWCFPVFDSVSLLFSIFFDDWFLVKQFPTVSTTKLCSSKIYSPSSGGMSTLTTSHNICIGGIPVGVLSSNTVLPNAFFTLTPNRELTLEYISGMILGLHILSSVFNPITDFSAPTSIQNIYFSLRCTSSFWLILVMECWIR